MRLRALAVAITTALVLGGTGAGGASAATEIGDKCAATGGVANYTLAGLQVGAGKPLPLTSPTAGVVTGWGVNIDPSLLLSKPYGERLTILRSTANADEFTAVSESSVETVNVGTNSFSTRLPIQAGDRLGGTAIGESEATFYCASTDPLDVLGARPGGVQVGSTQTIPAAAQATAALWATVEPDADNDGYGDETQDKCPQSTAVQTECPVVVLDSFAMPAKNKVVVLVGASVESPVTVSGSVKLPKSNGKAKASATAKLKKVTHNVTPGKLRYFSLKYPASLKRILAELPKGKKLKLKITASATNVAGQVSTDKATVRLKGNG